MKRRSCSPGEAALSALHLAVGVVALRPLRPRRAGGPSHCRPLAYEACAPLCAARRLAARAVPPCGGISSQGLDAPRVRFGVDFLEAGRYFCSMPDKSANEVPRDVRDLYFRGSQALQRHNFDYAMTFFTQALQRE